MRTTWPRFAVSLLLLINFCVQGQSRRMEPAAEGCFSSTLTCGPAQQGQLATGDCTFSDGSRYDVWRFSGTAGQVVEATLVPIDSTLTNGYIEIDPPAGDGSKTPAAGGAGEVHLKYILSSTGTWTILVSSFDVFASGRYTLALTCEGSNPTSNPQNCVAQPLSCGQSGDWFVTPSSCTFQGTPTWAYAPYNIGTLHVGDVIRLRAHSDAFDPYVSIYDHTGGNPLSSGFGTRFTQDADFVFNVPRDDSYHFIVYGPKGSTGEFFTTLTCSLAPCQSTVTIVSQPGDARVAAGGPGTINVSATGNGSLTYQWYEGRPPDTSLPFDSTTNSLGIPHVTFTRTFWVRVTNGCAHADSAAASIIPVPLSHPRAVRH